MPQRRNPITVIQFSRRLARQCRARGRHVPDWVVCDAIVNGSRRRMPGKGARYLFERAYTARSRLLVVRVLGTVKGPTCLATGLAAPVPGDKNFETIGFLNRSVSK
jgi:hypothetical protein